MIKAATVSWLLWDLLWTQMNMSQHGHSWQQNQWRVFPVPGSGVYLQGLMSWCWWLWWLGFSHTFMVDDDIIAQVTTKRSSSPWGQPRPWPWRPWICSCSQRQCRGWSRSSPRPYWRMTRCQTGSEPSSLIKKQSKAMILSYPNKLLV